MSLANLPHAIWQGVLINWLACLSAVVRVDCAYAVKKTESLLPVYAEKSFPCHFDTNDHDALVLASLCQWMRSKKVYISDLRLNCSESFPLLHWEVFFTWSSDTIQNLNIWCEIHACENAVLAASKTLRRLRNFDITGFENTKVIAHLLQNNANTLVSIVLDEYGTQQIMETLGVPSFPKLRVLQSAYSRRSLVCDFIRLCPNLIVLSLTGNDKGCNALLSTIAECCPLLRRLRLSGLEGLDDGDKHSLLCVARGCPHIERLVLWNAYFHITSHFAEVISALSCLHTLVIGELPESVLLALANGGAPSLRVLTLWMGLSYDSLRRHTAALPQLTGLSVLNFLGEPDCTNLFEHCGKLEHLHLRGYKETELISSTALYSVITYCPNLRTLELGKNVPYTHSTAALALDAVLNSCPKLRRIQIMDESCSREGYDDPRIVF